ncbi:hypothetical protein HU200_000090 [Digitaria exilis]|uniref:NB-ARC domain-containing protein n=1 Tax=Digitaria exilis TaxID=1010633 RepID=A0A835KYS2_9POAL|nr:hypothetical protein HU200_000090 [Digitaria exilis]
MGGLGKTTLAKMVYNDSRVQKHFELKLWYCVSENFEANVVVRSVIELATNGRCDLPDNIELLKGRLQEVIGRKRFLLILDDVWNEDHRKWEEDLRSLLCSSIGASGSMIVVTSRLQQVASIMGTLPPYDLQILSEDASWNLFSMKAFSNQGAPEQTELLSIGKRIVSKCKGLPLALSTMGGLMSSKQKVQEWKDIAECNISDTSRGKDDVVAILKLSYKHLSSEMKQCFAFCAMFPKDYEMEKDKERVMDLTDKGEYIFNELAWRSFLQDVSVKGCKMHDLMHDLATEVTDECASAQDLIQKKVSLMDVHHVQLSSYEFEEIGGLLKDTSSLRTLLTQSDHKDLSELKNMRSLRALRCERSSIIHSQLINTKHLRYLEIVNSPIVKLPDSLCMKKLSHIYLLGTRRLKRMPPNLRLLHNLRTLTKFVVDTRDGCGVEELKDMRQLGNHLQLCNLSKVKTGSEANLHEKVNLSNLDLSWTPDFGDGNNEVSDNEEHVLESLKPHDKLRMFRLSGYNGITIPQWMRDQGRFQCIRELEFYHCKKCKELPIIWLSSSLEKLSLNFVASLTTLCKNVEVEAAGYNISPQIFPQLRIMELVGLPDLERWAENSEAEPISQVMFPQLQKLAINDCPKLANLPRSPVLTHLDFSRWSASNPAVIPLGSLPSLVHLGVGALVELLIPAEDQQSQRPLENLRSLNVSSDDFFSTIFNSSKLQPVLRDRLAFLEVLGIYSCNNIVSWPVEELQCLPRLINLDIFMCDKLEGMGSSLEEILPLPRLKSLRIESCGCLLEIPRLPASLEKMVIWGCKSLVVLPDAMDGLTSLEYLSIRWCPRIEEFPHGLVNRLPALKYLQILGCPELQRRCREGGEYFDSVSSIRKKDIPFPATARFSSSSITKFVKKLLPSC